MASLRVVLFSLCVCLFVGSAISADPLPHIVAQLVKDMKSLMDPTTDPCQDFFQYACGTWVKENPVPANISKDTPYMNVPDILDIEAHIKDWAAEVVTQPWPIISDFYASCMQSATALNRDLMQTYTAYVKSVEMAIISTPQQRVDFYDIPTGQPISVGFFTNDDTRGHMLMIQFNGNSLSPNEYVPSNPEYQQLLQQATDAFLVFEGADKALADAKAVLEVEGFIANSTQNWWDRQNMTLRQFSAITKLDWSGFFGDLLQESDTILVPKDFAVITYFNLLSDTTFRRYFEWKLYQRLTYLNISQCVGITKDQAMANPFCAQLVEGVTVWDQHHLCAQVVIYPMMADYIGLIFTVEIVTDELIEDIHTMTEDIKTGFYNSLPNIDWIMQNKSNIEAVDFKLKNIIQNIGHSAVMNDYSDVALNPKTFFDNFNMISASDALFMLSQWNRPYNRSEETFPAETVNAFYDPGQNTINFPAGILESPMYSFSWPALWQYARIGYVVGHEITHGFDNTGSHFDAFGNFNHLFDAKTRQLFDQNAKCVVDYWGKFIAYGNTTMNGQQTLGENIADIGGVKNAHRAYQLYTDREGDEFADGELAGMTVDQVFFTIMGQTWCSVENQAYLKQQYERDVHSPFKYRVNGPLAQFDQFAKSFKCAANTPMNPPTRCDLW